MGWSFAGLAFSDEGERWTVVRLSISALHLTVGALFIFRQSLKMSGNVWQMVAALPSLLACGIAFVSSPSPQDWPWHAQTLFAIATLFAIVSLASLGKNFAVLPALRGIYCSGPYRWIRHPAYAGELAMVVACVLAGPNRWTVGAFAFLIPFIVLRINNEERLLLGDPEYGRYCEVTRSRLLPGIW